MFARRSNRRRRTAKIGWGMLVGLCGLLCVNGLVLYFVIVDTAPEQTLSILLTGFGMLGLVVSIEGFRRRTRWAWNATWVVVGLLGAVGLHMLAVGRPDVGAFYLVLASAGFIAQMLVRPSLRYQ